MNEPVTDSEIDELASFGRVLWHYADPNPKAAIAVWMNDNGTMGFIESTALRATIDALIEQHKRGVDTVDITVRPSAEFLRKTVRLTLWQKVCLFFRVMFGET